MIHRRKKNGDVEMVRPSFTHASKNEGDDAFTFEAARTQLAEDTRNTLEQIRDSQMLGCDVRSDIALLAREVRRMRKFLEEAVKLAKGEK